jgi:hypothetical protein
MGLRIGLFKNPIFHYSNIPSFRFSFDQSLAHLDQSQREEDGAKEGEVEQVPQGEVVEGTDGDGPGDLHQVGQRQEPGQGLGPPMGVMKRKMGRLNRSMLRTTAVKYIPIDAKASPARKESGTRSRPSG